MLGIILIVVLIALVGGIIVSTMGSVKEAPETQPINANNSETLVTVGQYLHMVDAQASRMRLESEGIKVYMADENFIMTNPLYSPAAGGIKIQVKSSDVLRAQQMLGIKPEKSQEPDEKYENVSEPCPKCGSNNVIQSKTFTGFLSGLSALLIGLPIPRKIMYCFSCKNKWKSVSDPKSQK
jgi:hypothetical protein